jgi:hypothetical protein
MIDNATALIGNGSIYAANPAMVHPGLTICFYHHCLHTPLADWMVGPVQWIMGQINNAFGW